jgi:NADH dehydrogenase [ubiquinone] 1 alpha subcomplex assembly factor 7
MRALQKEKLQPSVEKAGCQLHWHDSINDVIPSNQFSLVVAHEFFDALPVHVLQVCCLYHNSITSLPNHEV